MVCHRRWCLGEAEHPRGLPSPAHLDDISVKPTQPGKKKKGRREYDKYQSSCVDMVGMGMVAWGLNIQELR